MVNTQELQGSWNRVRGKIKEKWGNLTDDDLQVQGGNFEQLIGTIQQKTGESREAIERYLEDWSGQAAATMSRVTEKVGQYAQEIGPRAREQYQQVAEQVGEGYRQVQRAVRSNPTRSIAWTFGAGLMLGVVVGLSLRSR